jgi:hypothetical protein
MSANTTVRSSKGRNDHDRISLAGIIVRLFFIVAAAVLFNFFPQKVGYIRTATDPSSFTPLLGPGVRSFLPWLNLWWGLAFGLEIAHLILRRWITTTRWIGLALDVFGAVVLGAAAADTPFVEIPFVTPIARLALGLASIALLLSALVQFLRLLGRRPEPNLEGGKNDYDSHRDSYRESDP